MSIPGFIAINRSVVLNLVLDGWLLILIVGGLIVGIFEIVLNLVLDGWLLILTENIVYIYDKEVLNLVLDG